MNRSSVVGALGWLIMWVAVGVALGLAIIGYRNPAPDAVMIPPCVTEDGGPVPCFWNGPARGTPGTPGGRTGGTYVVWTVP